MEMVDVLIRLPLSTYNMCKANKRVSFADVGIIGKAIIDNGIALPKGHGNIVDMNTVSAVFNLQGELIGYDAEIIINADSEVE